MGKEKTVERKLIDSCHSIGMMAWHMDCSVDGFPDILAFGKDVSFVAEVKQGPVSTKLFQAFEESQPVWMMKVNSVGYKHVFQILYDCGTYFLYQIDDLWARVLNGDRFQDCEPLITSTKASIIAREMKRIAHGAS